VAVTALVPTAELVRYAIELRSLTAARGRFTARHAHYDVMPPHLAAGGRAPLTDRAATGARFERVGSGQGPVRPNPGDDRGPSLDSPCSPRRPPRSTT
jgi:translation elongation factor EF-G